jgi:hypothetical protein
MTYRNRDGDGVRAMRLRRRSGLLRTTPASRSMALREPAAIAGGAL